MQNTFQIYYFKCKIPNSFAFCISNAKCKIGIFKILFQNKIPFDQISDIFIYFRYLSFMRNRDTMPSRTKTSNNMAPYA